MAYTTFTPKAANTVQAQTITAIGDGLSNDPSRHYILADGSRIAARLCKTFPGAYVPVVGDYLVLATGTKGQPCVWNAAVFTSQYA